MSLAVEFDIDGDDAMVVLTEIMDELVGAIRDRIGEEPPLGVQIDGEHRDPDDPSEGLFS